ncbi:ABC transporter ATP-binding protein [Propylenella binzhouense]|uniref:ATP-binding cassette domain-containing protein n=1 Tax=Propylenella binzhouense TaxID=2555902 RepID=A0A964WVJ9_9HYPH|nr:ABC transporter ATP-binding protein [Propylenella binzhouense]MYZ50133.1 ATP-binding cassette domain-containing protein [Propylenella binzhouense]
MAFLELSNVTKGYGAGAARHEVLGGIDLSVAEGEFVAIVGFSGSGKTTLVSAIAGLVAPDAGEITVRGAPVTGPSPARGVVFQSYSLMPWLTAEENVALAVDSIFAAESRAARRARVERYIAMVGLTHARTRRPAELSGGMRQRVAVARALATEPELLLLDEPLSALDALTRAKLQDEIVEIWSKEKRTVILITNDVDEAILLADRVIPLTPGPAARLGPGFEVDLPRPRDRAALNHDEGFRRLRSAIIRYLDEAGGARQQGAAAEPRPEPNAVVPFPRKPAPPRAYREASASPIEARYVEFAAVSKTFPTPKGPLTVVEDFSLKMRKGEFVSLIGHSGCGKSTVLGMAAGLLEVSGGGIVLDGTEVTGAGPERAVVFQSPSLFPWLTARENVALGVERVYPKAGAAERREIVEYYLARVGLAEAMDRRAAELSNGMKQRVGIARAFALSPKLLLLDEPFGMLDSLTRWELQDVLMDVWKRSSVTAICVTHDVDEAILLADRIVMMTNGPRARIGAVLEIDLPRPRARKALLGLPEFYEYREELLGFLEAYEGGANPDPAHLEAIRLKRAGRTSPGDRSTRLAAAE